jgi:hypothetical protein
MFSEDLRFSDIPQECLELFSAEVIELELNVFKV